jgi:hypothetical protein
VDQTKFVKKPNSIDAGWEIRLGYLLPVLFIMGAMVSLAMTQPSWDFEGFVELALHAERQADYLADAVTLSFAPVNPDIVEEVRGDQAELPELDDENKSSDGIPNPGFPTATMQPSSGSSETETPTNAATTPTDSGILVPPSPTLPLPTLPLPTIDIPVPTIPVISDVVNTLIPTPIVCLPLIGCP